MADSRIHAWLSHVPHNGPRWLSLALAALIALELARAAATLVAGGQLKSLTPAPVRRPPVPHNAGVDVASIVAAHLFGVAAGDPNAQDPAHAPATTASLLLTGTVATQDPKHGFAIIADDGPSKVYSVGDSVNGASLHSVYLYQVVLDRGGVLETLKLPRLLGGRPPPGPTPGANPRMAAAANTPAMGRQDSVTVGDMVRMVASNDNAAGKLRGFRVYAGQNRAAFIHSGLKGGDLVTAINGIPINDPQHGQEMLNTIQTSAAPTLTIERGGHAREITLSAAYAPTDESGSESN